MPPDGLDFMVDIDIGLETLVYSDEIWHMASTTCYENIVIWRLAIASN